MEGILGFEMRSGVKASADLRVFKPLHAYTLPTLTPFRQLNSDLLPIAIGTAFRLRITSDFELRSLPLLLLRESELTFLSLFKRAFLSKTAVFLWAVFTATTWWVSTIRAVVEIDSHRASFPF